MGIGERLRELREAKHLNQEAFGALGGVSIKTQNRYEMGGRKPTFDYLEALAAAGVDVVYLLTGDTDPRKLPERENEMLRAWRAMSTEHQDDAFRLMEAWRQKDSESGRSKTMREGKGNEVKTNIRPATK
jgi:transcriptional regulator with XRE-family HTH domain